MNIIDQYNNGEISGWGDPDQAKEEYEKNKDDFLDFDVFGSQPPTRKMFLYQIVRKVLGSDIENIPQLTSDCVGWGGRTATEYLSCADILMRGDAEKHRPVSAAFYYGISRMFGNFRIWGGGSFGSWLAKAVMKYGTLFTDEPGVPKYSGNLSDQWGKSPGPPKQFLEMSKNYLVKSAALIKSWDDLVKAICNGYPCTCASNVGFEMLPRKDGFHYAGPRWPHQMGVVGIDDESSDPYVLIRNSWGNVHGKLVSFDDKNEILPTGYLRVRRKTMEQIISDGEVYAFSQFDGFPSQDLNKKLFKLFGE